MQLGAGDPTVIGRIDVGAAASMSPLADRGTTCSSPNGCTKLDRNPDGSAYCATNMVRRRRAMSGVLGKSAVPAFMST